MCFNKIFAVLLAAGSANRFSDYDLNNYQKKQYIDFFGKPLFLYSLRAFLRVSTFSRIYLVYFPGDKNLVLSYLKKFNIDLIKNNIFLVPGSNSRSLSVYNALIRINKIASCYDFILIHDVARPFVKISDIYNVIDNLFVNPSVTLSCLLSDSIKQFSLSGDLIAEIDRNNLRAIQTPQGFRYKYLWEAYNKYSFYLHYAKDDIQLMKFMNVNIKLIMGSILNLKITYPSDLTIAKLIYKNLYF